MSLDPWRLRMLVQFADVGTVRGVSQAMSLSPSAVSQQLTVLEREARTTLLDRHGRRLTLTPAGRRLVEHARDILERIDAAERDLVDLGTEPAGPVRITAFASALGSLVIPAVARLAVGHPVLEPSSVESEPAEALPALLRGECDIAVVAAFLDGSTPADARIATVPLARDPLVAVVPMSWADDGGNFRLSSLRDERWVLDAANGYLSELVLRICRQSGFEPAVVGRYQSYALLLQQVEAGGAVTVLPRLAVDDRYQVQAIPLKPVVLRQISVAIRAGVTPRRAVQVVIAELLDVARALAR